MKNSNIEEYKDKKAKRSYATVREDKNKLEALTPRQSHDRREPSNNDERVELKNLLKNYASHKDTTRSSFNYYESAEAFNKTKANLQSELKALESNTYPIHTFSSRIVNCMGAVLSQRTERPRKDKQAINSYYTTSIIHDTPKNISIVNDHFGINHSREGEYARVRESEREEIRERLREEMALSMREAQEKSLRRKTKL